MKQYHWNHQIVDLGRLQTGLGVIWSEPNTLLAITLSPDRTQLLKRSLPESIPGQLTQKSLPSILEEQLIQALHGEPVEWNWFPNLDSGTAFQQRIWQILEQCPHGDYWSYKELADRSGNSKAVRAVGSACGKNPFPLRIPCHRIVASNGTLGGFTGDLELKKWILQKETEHTFDVRFGTSDRALP